MPVQVTGHSKDDLTTCPPCAGGAVERLGGGGLQGEVAHDEGDHPVKLPVGDNLYGAVTLHTEGESLQSGLLLHILTGPQ